MGEIEDIFDGVTGSKKEAKVEPKKLNWFSGNGNEREAVNNEPIEKKWENPLESYEDHSSDWNSNGNWKLKAIGFLRVLAIIVLIAAILALILFFVRISTHSELVGLSPARECYSGLINRSDILWVIPDLDNNSIAFNNTVWCKFILATNKTIGMQGVYGTANEFKYVRGSDYFKQGVNDFAACFGFMPEQFMAPDSTFNSGNNEFLVERGLVKVNGFSSIFHKVYHCDNSGFLSNDFVDMF